MEDKIKGWIKNYIINSYENKRYRTNWKTPLISFIKADNPGFMEIREKIGSAHLLPQDILSGAASVIVYFLPFEDNIISGNSGGELASEEWVQAYIDTNSLINNLNNDLAKFISEYNYDSAVLPPTHNFDKEKLVSWWSHKHVAYIAGLGNFGLHQMLITDSGCAGRFGSIITTMPLYESREKSKAGCLWFENGSCGLCIKKCNFGELKYISFDRKMCYDILLNN